MIEEYPYHSADVENFVRAADKIFSDCNGRYGIMRDNIAIGVIVANYRHIMIIKYRMGDFIINGPRIRWLASITSLLPGGPSDMGSAISDDIEDVIRLTRDIIDGAYEAPYRTISQAKEALKAMG